MRSAIAAILAVAAGLALANMLGVAAAEAPTTATPVRTISVDGVADVPIAQGANMAVARSVYREGMAAAVADGQGKAEFLASKTAATLGSVQSVLEGGGSIQCTGGEEAGYVEYDGEQPDFGSPTVSVSPGVASASAPSVPKPQVKQRKKKHKRKPSAKAAIATTCTLSTDVTLVYAIS